MTGIAGRQHAHQSTSQQKSYHWYYGNFGQQEESNKLEEGDDDLHLYRNGATFTCSPGLVAAYHARNRLHTRNVLVQTRPKKRWKLNNGITRKRY